MHYVKQYRQLKDLFDTDQEKIIIPGSQTIIRNLEFLSKPDLPSATNKGSVADNQIDENIKFRYPVLMPHGKVRNNHVILYLHGLNERSWNKHLTGAKFLAEKSGCAVILFPLSYHINRGLPEWTDVRKMSGLLDIRKLKYPDVKEASVVNLALSERLTENPGRFFISGHQSAMDLICLLKDIQSGKHPFFESGTRTDIFAYSISCMMLQALMIVNPDNLLGNSRIVFFAGGSLFSHMQGVSRYIMDSIAFESVKKFYLEAIRRKRKLTAGFPPGIPDSSYGRAFKAIIAPDLYKNIREKAMSFYKDKLMVIALRDDKVNPVEGIRHATGENYFRSRNFRIVHFPYAYTHENPFPVLYRNIDEQVETAFQSVFNPALSFYTR